MIVPIRILAIARHRNFGLVIWTHYQIRVLTLILTGGSSFVLNRFSHRNRNSHNSLIICNKIRDAGIKDHWDEKSMTKCALFVQYRSVYYKIKGSIWSLRNGDRHATPIVLNLALSVIKLCPTFAETLTIPWDREGRYRLCHRLLREWKLTASVWTAWY